MSDSSLQIIIEAIDNASKTIAGIQRSLRDTTTIAGKMNSVGRGLQNIGQSMTRNVTIPVVAGLALAAKAAIEFESSMADVNKAFSLQSGTKEAAEMSDQIQQISRRVPIAASGIAEIAAEAGKLGVQRNQMEPFVELVGQMGTAFDMSSAQAGDSIAKLSNILGYMDKTGRVNIEGLRSLGDTINFVGDNSATSAAEIVDVITRIGGVGRNARMTNDQMVGLSASFLNLGLAPEVAGTAIRSFIPALQSATRMSPKAQQAMQELGISASDIEQAFKRDATGAMRTFLETLGKAENKAGIITDIFGKGSDSAAIAQLASDLTQFDKAFSLIGDNSKTGSMMQEFATRSKTTANQLQLLGNNINIMAINLGAALLPAINDITSALIPMVEGFGKFAKANPEITKIAVALGLVLAAVGPLVWVIGGLVSAFGAIASAAGVVGGGLAALGLPSFGAAAVLAANGIRAIASSVLGLGAILAAAAFGFVNLFSAMSGNGAISPQVFMATINEAIAQLPVNLAQIIPTTQAIMSSWGVAIQMALVNLRSNFTIFAFEATTAVISAWQNILSATSAAWAGIVAAVSGAIAGFVSAIQSGMSSAQAAVSGAMSAIIGIVQGAASGMFAAGFNIVNSIAQGIMSGIGAIQSAGAAVASAVAAFLPHSPPKEGALRDIMQVGGRIVNIIADGIVPNPISSAMNKALSPVDPSMMAIASPNTFGGGGSGTSNAITVNISINGTGADAGGLTDTLEARLSELLPRLMRESDRQKGRVAYS